MAESDFLRNFTRIGMGKVMSYALLCDAFKSISESTWNYINDLVKTQATEKHYITPECLRLDSTVCETNIHFPTDASLLWDMYRTLARLIRQCNKEAPEWNMGNRFHDKKIKKLYTYIATYVGRKNKSTKRKVNRFIIVLIQRVADLCETTKRYVDHAKVTPTLSQAAAKMLKELDHFRGLGCKVVDQSQRMYINGEKVFATERIFSIFEEHTELLKRGKAQKPVEFGHMVTIGQTKEKWRFRFCSGRNLILWVQVKTA